MTKKKSVKKEDKETEDQESIALGDMDSVLKGLSKEFGNVIATGQNILERELVTIPIAPRLDMATGGGILEGTTVIFSGQPKSGKTLTSLHFAATCQKPEYGGKFCPEGREVFILDVEGRLRKRDLIGIPGFNIDKVHIIQSEPGNMLTAEKFLSIGEKLIHTIPGCVVILDSASALCTQKEMTSEMSDQQRAEGAKLMYKFFRKVGTAIGINRCIVIAIQHIMANPGMGNANWAEKGGQAVKYQVDTHLRILYHKPWLIGKEEDNNQIGQKVNWRCITSSVGPPGKECESFVRYGYGVDVLKEYIEIGIDIGLILQKGSWYRLVYLGPKNPEETDKKKIKYISPQGIEKLQVYMEENKDEYLKLKEQVDFMTRA